MIVAIVAVVAGGLGFFGGMQYQKTNEGSSGPRGQFQQRTDGQIRPEGFSGGNGAGPRAGFSPVSGEILAIDDQTITVQTQEGDSKIVIYSGSTNINKTSEGSLSDLQVGEEVTVIGTEDDNGTVTAQSISLGEEGIRGMPGGQPPTAENN